HIGYAVIRVDSRVVNPLASQSDYLKVRDKLSGAVQKKRLSDILNRAAQKIEKDLAPEFNEDGMKALRKALLPSDSSLPLSLEAGAGLKDISSMNLVRFRGGWWTIGQAVDRMMQTTERQRRRLKSAGDIREFIIGLAVREVTIERAKTAGLESDTAVAQQ